VQNRGFESVHLYGSSVTERVLISTVESLKPVTQIPEESRVLGTEEVQTIFKLVYSKPMALLFRSCWFLSRGGS
jgi:hypothetical protein